MLDVQIIVSRLSWRSLWERATILFTIPSMFSDKH
jgi:hypothetical protein